MKRLFISTVLVLISILSFGQNDIAGLMEKLDSHKVTLNYSCTVRLDVPMKSRGSLTVQQNCYKLSAAGVDIYCDGESRWTVDTSSKEVFIEEATGVKEFLSNSQGYLDILSDLELSDVTIEPLDKTPGIFSFDDKSLDSSWIVTDFR